MLVPSRYCQDKMILKINDRCVSGQKLNHVALTSSKMDDRVISGRSISLTNHQSILHEHSCLCRVLIPPLEPWNFPRTISGGTGLTGHQSADSNNGGTRLALSCMHTHRETHEANSSDLSSAPTHPRYGDLIQQRDFADVFEARKENMVLQR